jgi:peptide/nickel transport system ATP-binding protein
MSGDVLIVEDLHTWFSHGDSSIRAVDGLDLRIGRNETVALVGESGCGKSVTGLSIMRLVPAGGNIVSGSIRLGDRELTQLSEREMGRVRGREVSMIFQEPMTSLNPLMTIGEQIMEVIRYHLGYTPEQARKRVMDLLALVGFASPARLLGEYPHRLSGGMRQRVMIAIAIACEPQLLIADEPTTALDVTIQAQILELLGELSQRVSTAILLITHDLAVVSEVADRVAVMYSGQAVETAPAKRLFDAPRHPYTRGLVECIPGINGPVTRLRSIPGSVPRPDALPLGCRFAPRCPHAFGRCTTAVPAFYEVGDSHAARCYLYDTAPKGLDSGDHASITEGAQ